MFSIITKNKTSLYGIASLFGILLMGATLYLYNLGNIPPGLGLDEVSPGYNAYSLLQTGKDEYGKSFPISFRFNSTYSPPLYTYLTVPMIAIFGLEIAAVRMISVICAIGSIIILFLFLRKLDLLQNKSLTYLGAAIYMMLPWVIIYARSGYEGMLPFFIYGVSVLLIWIGFKKPIFLIYGLSILSLSTYSSYTNRFLAPLLIIGFISLFYKILLDKENRKFFLIGLLGALLIQIPNFSIIFTKSFLVKSELSFGSNLLTEYSQTTHILPAYIEIPYLYIREFLSQYFTYFSLRSLFWDADPLPFRSIPGLSVFYPWMFIPYLVGLFTVWSNKNKLNYRYILFLTLITPIPAALTKDPFWTYRAIPLLLPLMIIITIGIDRIISLRIPFLKFISALIILTSVILLWQGYFVFLPNERAKAWQHGYSTLAQEINSRRNEAFVIDNSRNSLTYLELAFFLQIPPEELQSAVNQEVKKNYYNNINFDPNYSFANVNVRSIDWKDVFKDFILVGDDLAFSEDQIREHELSKVFEIKDPLGKILFVGYRTNPTQKCLNGILNKQILDAACEKLIR